MKMLILNMEKEQRFTRGVELFSKENTFILVVMVKQISDRWDQVSELLN